MNKFNKKGFTLIEMLVVIAIIAVLVSIVIPTVSSSTQKAKAATDAANLRSAKAAVTIGVLEGIYNSTNAPTGETGAAALGIPYTSKYDGTSPFTCTITAGSGTNDVGSTVEVKYGTMTIADLAVHAGGTGNS